MTSRTVDITVLFDDVSQDTSLQAAHGAAYLIEGLSRTILFDTGGDGYILLENMAKLGKNPKDVDLVVISHAHWDHSGGLFAFLREASDDVEVFVPKAVSKGKETSANAAQSWFSSRTFRTSLKPSQIWPRRLHHKIPRRRGMLE